MDEKLIRDALGSPVPQHYNEELGMFTVNTLDSSTVTNGDIDFSQTKLLRDRLGSVIPQVWDALNHKWVVVTTQNVGGGGGEAGPITWDNIQGKPSEFTPSKHTHEMSEINGLQGKLAEIWSAITALGGQEPPIDLPTEPTNLWDGTYTNAYLGGAGIYSPSSNARSTNMIPVNPNTTYLIKSHKNRLRIQQYSNDSFRVFGDHDGTLETIITTSDDITHFRIYYYSGDDSSYGTEPGLEVIKQ